MTPTRLAAPDGADGLVVPLAGRSPVDAADEREAPRVPLEAGAADAERRTADERTEADADAERRRADADAGRGRRRAEPAPAGPGLITFAPGPAVEPPALDSYSLRLVVDPQALRPGTLVQRRPRWPGSRLARSCG